MNETFKLNLIKKEIDKSAEYDGIPVKETRWFVETNDGFDGSAQGYGYKSPQAVYKAYAYFKSKDKRKAETDTIENFLKDNPDIRKALNSYMDGDWAIDRMKDGEDSSIENMIEYFKEDEPAMVKKLQDNKHLWKALMKYTLEH